MQALQEQAQPSVDVAMGHSGQCWRWLVEREGSEQWVAERDGVVVGVAPIQCRRRRFPAPRRRRRRADPDQQGGSGVPPDALASLLLGPYGAIGLAERLPDCHLAGSGR